MTKKYDVTTKDLVELRPEDWLGYLGLPPAPVEVVEAELSTVSLAADKVLRVLSSRPWLLHLEFQSGHDVSLLLRTLHYNIILFIRHGLPVRSVIVIVERRCRQEQYYGNITASFTGYRGIFGVPL